MSDHILPTGDLAFKKVLANEENKDILCGLINDFFNESVTPDELTIENPYSIIAFTDAIKGTEEPVLRHTIKDVAATFKTADMVCEMQLRTRGFFEERMIYYPCERFCQNYNKRGAMILAPDGTPDRYSSLRPVYGFNIIGKSHFTEDNDALRILVFHDPIRNKAFKQLIKIGFFELGKSNVETINQKYWRDYFLTGEANPEAPDYIRKAGAVISKVNLSEEEKHMAQVLEKAQAIHDAEKVTAFYEGKQQAAVEFARKLLHRNMNLADIAEDTGLSIKELYELKSNLSFN